MRPQTFFAAPATMHKVRFQSSAATAAAAKMPSVISIRSSGYGPSGDVLKGVPLHSHVSLITKAPLHPEDARIQKEVLALAMPSLSGVTVESQPRHSTYAPASLPLAQASDAHTASHVNAAIVAELDLRMQMLEISVRDQLATVANLVVDRVTAQTDHQLSALEAVQAERSQTLAQLIINCIQAELRASGAGTEGRSDLAEHVAQRVARVLQAVEQAPDAPRRGVAAGAALDSRMEQYFSTLQRTMKEAVVDKDAGLSTTNSKQILKAMDQAFRVQEESIRDVMKSLAPSAGGDSQRELEEFIEGSLRTAADNIRLHVTSELKKYSKAPARSAAGRGAASEADDGATSASTAQLEERLQQLVDGAADMAAAVAHVDDVASDIFKEQAELKALLTAMQARDTVPTASQHSPGLTSTDAAHSADVAAKAAADEAQLAHSVAELKSLLWRVNSALEVSQSKQETMLLDMAQSISASVVGAVSPDQGGAAALVSHSVEQVLSSNMAALVAKLDASEQAVDARMSSIATLVSDTVRETLSDWERTHPGTAAPPHAPTASADAETNTDSVVAPEAVEATSAPLPSTEALRDALVAAVQGEMGKTHEVNLTPMYQYVDSILAFLKEELAQQNTAMTSQFDSIRSTLASVPAAGTVTLADLHTKLEELLRRPSQPSSPVLEQQLEAMEAAAKQRNQELLDTIKSSASLDATVTAQLTAIESVLKTETTNTTTANMAVNGKLEELALAMTEQRAVLDRVRDAQLQDDKATRFARVEPLTPTQKEQWRVLQEKRSTRIEKISSLVRTIDRAPTQQLGSLTVSLTAELSALYTLEQQEKALADVVTAPKQDGDATTTAADPFVQLEQALARVAGDLSSSQSRVGEDVLAAIRQLPSSLTGEQVQERLDATTATLLKAQASDLDAALDKHSNRVNTFIQSAMSQWQSDMTQHRETVVMATDMAQASHQAAVSSSSSRPWLWLAANAFIVGLTVMLCVYYIAACALVALVPKKTAASAQATPPTVDGAAPVKGKRPNPTRKPLSLADDVM